MANNLDILDGAGATKTVKTTDNASVHTPHHNIDAVIAGTGATNLGKAEDAAHTSGDVGVMALSVRQDTAAALAGTDADYQPLITDASGRLHVNVGNTVTVGSHAVTNAGTFAVQATVAAAATNIAKAEDVASADADVGVPAMAVRKATPANTSGTDGDYEMLQMSAGRLWVDASGVSLTVGSHAVTNAGTFVVQENGSALTALQKIDDPVFVDDAAFTPATSSVMMIGAEVDDTGTDSVDEGDAGAVRMSANRNLYVRIRDNAGNERGLNIDANGELGIGAIRSALPAGTNAIGKLAANSGVDIGDVDVTSVPTDPFGANADAASATGSISAKLRFIASTGIPITGTVTVGSHAVTNAGTFAVQVDGNALTSLQLIDDIVYTDDTSTHATGTSKGALLMAAATPTDASVDANDIGAVAMTTDRQLNVRATVASGGIASGAVASGAIASGAVASGAFASGSIASGAIAAGAIAAGATSIAENEDVGSADGDRGVKILFKRKDSPANSSGTDLDYEQPQMSAGRIWASATIDAALPAGTNTIGGAFGYATTVNTTVTRPGDTTQYSANDAWADSTSSPTTGGFTFTSAARASGGSGIITDIWITSSNDPATLLQGELWIFDSAVTAVNDNAAFALGDSDTLLGVAVVPFAMASTVAGSGTTSYAHIQNLSIGFTCVGSANLRFLVKVKNGYTPANAETLNFKLKIIQTN